MRGLAIELGQVRSNHLQHTTPLATQSPAWVEQRLQGVCTLLPDLPNPQELQRDVVLHLLAHYDALPARIVGLRQLLPRVNLSAMFINLPRLLIEPPIPWLAQHIEFLKCVRGVELCGVSCFTHQQAIAAQHRP